MGPAVHSDGRESVVTGILAALPEELGRWNVGEVRERQGLAIVACETHTARVLACVSGVGKVRAARAATLLLTEGAGRLLVVGTCGGLRRHLGPGQMVHCQRAVQADFSMPGEREFEADAGLRAAWQAEAAGSLGWFLTADRPVLSVWRKLRLARAFSGDCVADMETAAVAAVASAAGVGWAALRAVTDRAGTLGAASFQLHYPVQAPRAADTIPGLLSRLADLPTTDPNR